MSVECLTRVVALLLAVAAAGADQASRGVEPSAIITMVRENRCGFGQQDPKDLRQCPDYSVSLTTNGTVTYQGRAGVQTIGVRSHQVSPEAVRALADEFERAGFFQLRDRYEEIQVNGGWQTIDHALATTLTVAIGTRTKTVYAFYGTPAIVEQLARRVDDASDSWRYSGRPRSH